MSIPCKICGDITTPRTIKVRSGKEMEIMHCNKCDYDFFSIDPSEALAANKLDESRLKAAGLDIPSVEKDFVNGTRQSLPYLEKYISEDDKGENILEIGGSWGYFLKLVQDKGANPYGVELNTLRTHYVNDVLGIPCYSTLEECESKGIKFRQIFLFYVFEYVHEPVAYLNRLMDMLDDNGRVVLITPNLSDVLKDIWLNEAFGKFFYDENAVNYFKPTSIRNLIGKVKHSKHSVEIIQGYSFVNHLSWYLTNAPRTTGMVGGDYYINDIATRLESSGTSLGQELSDAMKAFDKQYRSIIEKNEYGNQVEIILYK